MDSECYCCGDDYWEDELSVCPECGNNYCSNCESADPSVCLNCYAWLTSQDFGSVSW